MSNAGEKFQKYLASRGLRWTRERKTICDEACSSNDPFDIDQLISRVNRTAENRVSRATAYRTVAELVDAGILQPMRYKDRNEFKYI